MSLPGYGGITAPEGAQMAWAEVCPLLSDVGPARQTGWQDATVTITAPATANPGNEALAFSVGGWNYDGWYGLIDGIEVTE